MYMKRVPRKKARPRPKKREIICAECGRKGMVGFRPRGFAPVLCSRCYRKMKRQRK